ncbi:MAG: hypothetical protein WBM48_00570 [Polyangiales bacterium]|jgi:hypothetical protein
MRYVVGFVWLLVLVASPLAAGAQAGEEGRTSEPSLQDSASEEAAAPLELDDDSVKLAPGPPQVAYEYAPSPKDSYGIRYARRKLAMPKGMMRGTFDVVTGRVSNENTTTINFGAAVSPAKHLEVGFSRYRIGSYPNPDVLRALGGDGLIPIVAQGRDLIPVGSTNNSAFGDMFAYLRVEAPTEPDSDRYAEAPATSVLDIAFDVGFLLPTASEFGLLFGVPIRFHGGDVFAFDAGLMINVDNIGGDGGLFTSIALPWNLVFSATDFLFVKLDSGLDAIGVTEGDALKVFPAGFGVGGTVAGKRIMSDIFAAFSWPILGIVDVRGANTDVWTITIGTNLYSPVLF